MSHEIESMFYVRREGIPWHRLGTPVEGIVTSVEALVKAGLDWSVSLQPIFTRDPRTGELVPILDRRATVRFSDGSILGVVSNEYKLLQNVEAFQFFDEIVGEGEAVYHTAGSLLGGRRIWILAKLPGTIQVVGDDMVERYLLLSNGHDGTVAVHIGFTPIRVVCANTLSMATNSMETDRTASRLVVLEHRGDLTGRFAETRKLLGIINARYDEIKERMRLYAATQMTLSQQLTYCETVFSKVGDDSQSAHNLRMDRLFGKTVNLLETGYGVDIPGVKGTLWHVNQAVVELIDYHGRFKGDRQLHSMWFGLGAQVKQRADTLAFKIATNLASNREMLDGVR